MSTAAKVFPEGTSVLTALEIIASDADDIVKGAIVGMSSMMVLGPKCGLNVATVIGVIVSGTVMDGYMISVTPSVEMAEQPYDKVCESAIIQRFIGVNETGRAVNFVPAGKSAEGMYAGISGLLN